MQFMRWSSTSFSPGGRRCEWRFAPAPLAEASRSRREFGGGREHNQTMGRPMHHQVSGAAAGYGLGGGLQNHFGYGGGLGGNRGLSGGRVLMHGGGHHIIQPRHRSLREAAARELASIDDSKDPVANIVVSPDPLVRLQSILRSERASGGASHIGLRFCSDGHHQQPPREIVSPFRRRSGLGHSCLWSGVGCSPVEHLIIDNVFPAGGVAIRSKRSIPRCSSDTMLARHSRRRDEAFSLEDKAVGDLEQKQNCHISMDALSREGFDENHSSPTAPRSQSELTDGGGLPPRSQSELTDGGGLPIFSDWSVQQAHGKSNESVPSSDSRTPRLLINSSPVPLAFSCATVAQVRAAFIAATVDRTDHDIWLSVFPFATTASSSGSALSNSLPLLEGCGSAAVDGSREAKQTDLQQPAVGNKRRHNNNHRNGLSRWPRNSASDCCLLRQMITKTCGAKEVNKLGPPSVGYPFEAAAAAAAAGVNAAAWQTPVAAEGDTPRMRSESGASEASTTQDHDGGDVTVGRRRRVLFSNHLQSMRFSPGEAPSLYCPEMSQSLLAHCTRSAAEGNGRSGVSAMLPPVADGFRDHPNVQTPNFCGNRYTDGKTSSRIGTALSPAALMPNEDDSSSAYRFCCGGGGGSEADDDESDEEEESEAPMMGRRTRPRSGGADSITSFGGGAPSWDWMYPKKPRPVPWCKDASSDGGRPVVGHQVTASCSAPSDQCSYSFCVG